MSESDVPEDTVIVDPVGCDNTDDEGPEPGEIVPASRALRLAMADYHPQVSVLMPHTMADPMLAATPRDDDDTSTTSDDRSMSSSPTLGQHRMMSPNMDVNSNITSLDLFSKDKEKKSECALYTYLYQRFNKQLRPYKGL